MTSAMILYLLIIYIHSAVLIQLQPKRVVVFVGENLPSLKCQTSGKEVLWSRDDEIISYGKDIIINDKRYKIDSSREGQIDLTVQQLKYSEGGIYTCKDTDGRVINVYDVIIRLKARIDQSTPSPVYIEEGQPASLSCNASGRPQPTISWFIADDIKDTDTWLDISIRGPVLRIYNISRYCQGNYVCMADNGLADPDKKIFEIYVTFAPEVFIKSKIGDKLLDGNVLTVTENQKLALRCHVTSSPSAEVTWKIGDFDLATFNPQSGQITRNIANINRYSNIIDFNILNNNEIAPLQYILEMTLFQFYRNSSYTNYFCSATNNIRTTTNMLKLQKRKEG